MKICTGLRVRPTSCAIVLCRQLEGIAERVRKDLTEMLIRSYFGSAQIYENAFVIPLPPERPTG